MSELIRIAVDVMGGDNYPEAPIFGGLMALRDFPDLLIDFVGNEDVVKAELRQAADRLRCQSCLERAEIIASKEIITTNEDPVKSVRKRQSSMRVGLKALSEDRIKAFVSAGNTGALLVNSHVIIKPIAGIDRAALTAIFPTANGPCVALDMGANSENTSTHLVQYGVMGKVYSKEVMGVVEPRVALINIGKEDDKGDTIRKEAHKSLKTLSANGILNFIGNIEGNDIFRGEADVVIVDGFTGNVVLKLAESLLPTLNEAIKNKLRDSSIFRKFFALVSRFLLGPTIGSIKREFDYEQYGGAPLLGARKIVVKAHGRSTPVAIKHAIGYAREAATLQITEKIEKEIQRISL